MRCVRLLSSVFSCPPKRAGRREKQLSLGAKAAVSGWFGTFSKTDHVLGGLLGWKIRATEDTWQACVSGSRRDKHGPRITVGTEKSSKGILLRKHKQ